eukprot:1137474-Pelagomonas_calceolata.AAC.4
MQFKAGSRSSPPIYVSCSSIFASIPSFIYLYLTIEPFMQTKPGARALHLAQLFIHSYPATHLPMQTKPASRSTSR